ncbi:hypothetical protein QOT17_017662 [Balamuthia mandrillaris]
MSDGDPRATNEGLRKVSKGMFIAGFFFLPFLWLVNYVYLRKYIRRASCPAEVRFYVRTSLLGFLLVTLVLFTWTLVFLIKRNDMGEAGDKLSLWVPKGP